MDFLDIKFWAGTDESLAVYMAVARQLLQGDGQGLGAQAIYRPDEGEERTPRLLSKTGDIAVIRIQGSLNNTDSWINEYRGMTGYPEIREALVHAATDPTVGAIVLDINSGGGSVSGVFDTGNLIRKVDTLKPVHAFSDGQIASAAYLLGASARTVNIGKMTEAGSVGVLSVHQEISKMLKENGVTPTVLRSGKYKALGNPYEPLSEMAQAEIQGQLDQMYEIFVDYVADRRKVSYDVADKKLAQGRVFIGEKAVEIGLVDSVTSFDALASKLQGGIDSKKPGSKYAPNLNQGKTVAGKSALTEQDIALIASGAASPELLAAAAAAATTQGEGVAAPAAPAAEGAASAAAPAAAAETTDPATTATTEPAGKELVDFLKAQLADRDETVLSLKVEVRDLKASAEKNKANHSAFRAVAATSVGYLRTALNASGAKVEDMTDDALLAEQASLSAQFQKSFKAGGVAAVSSSASEKQGKAPVNAAAQRARIEATRPQ